MVSTREANRQVRVATAFMEANPDYIRNVENGNAMYDVLIQNELPWTLETLQIAYRILKIRKHKFSKKKLKRSK